MAKIITVEQKEQAKNSSIQKPTTKSPLFRKINYILMGICVFLLILGYILLSGGKSPDPEGFSPEIFSTRRIVVSPIIMLAGIIAGVFAIMYHPQNKNPKE